MKANLKWNLAITVPARTKNSRDLAKNSVGVWDVLQDFLKNNEVYTARLEG
jgi:hypothetical protein